jgi:hypothetical protein
MRGHPETVDYDDDCAYCTERGEHFCSNCNRRICPEHARRAEGEVFCEPLPDETVAHYIRHGRAPACGEGARP